MTQKFEISIDWLGAAHGPQEVGKTSALIKILIGTRTATRIDDDWSQSVHSRVRLSAYPLALWFATSWWRLLWEPEPLNSRSLDWRMSHEMPAAGFGFLWPQLTFASDGETVDVKCAATRETSAEPVHYLSSFHDAIDAAVFAETIREFIEKVIARLEEVRLQDTDLHRAWRELFTHELGGPTARGSRILEARLGFDPGEADTSLMEFVEPKLCVGIPSDAVPPGRGAWLSGYWFAFRRRFLLSKNPIPPSPRAEAIDFIALASHA